jgi:hypothetical protein
MQPTAVWRANLEDVKGQLRTLGVSDDFDHVIAAARVGGGEHSGQVTFSNAGISEATEVTQSNPNGHFAEQTGSSQLKAVWM